MPTFMAAVILRSLFTLFGPSKKKEYGLAMSIEGDCSRDICSARSRHAEFEDVDLVVSVAPDRMKERASQCCCVFSHLT